MKKIVLAGGGVLGSQIAYQSAFCGFDVTVWLMQEDWLIDTKEKVEALHEVYANAIEVMNSDEGKLKGNWVGGISSREDFDYQKCINSNNQTLGRITFLTDLTQAVKDADLVIEAIIENQAIKAAFYQDLAKVQEDKTIVVTNTSTLLPSMFINDTKHPEKFLCLHFMAALAGSNIVEVMPHSGTDNHIKEQVIEFATQINMLPIVINKEHAGFISNSLIVPFLSNAMALWSEEIASIEDIDTAWNTMNGGVGPFRILDRVGLNTSKNIMLTLPGGDDPETINGRIVTNLDKMISEKRKFYD